MVKNDRNSGYSDRKHKDFWKLHIKYLVDDEIIEDEEDKEYFEGDEYDMPLFIKKFLQIFLTLPLGRHLR